MTTSHRPASSVVRMNPRRCGDQTYASGRFSSRATSAAILFSNPSAFAFEKGRLLGSAHTRRGGRASALSRTHAVAAIAIALQTEDIHRASRRRVLLDVL